MKRTAQAHWTGTGKDGKGHLTTQSGVLSENPYSFRTRFENEDGALGTNPEELIAAAHAGCFTMKLAFNLQAAGFEASSLDTEGIVQLRDGAVTQSHLSLKAAVADIDENQFAELVKDAEENCPISKLLDTDIRVTYTLN